MTKGTQQQQSQSGELLEAGRQLSGLSLRSSQKVQQSGFDRFVSTMGPCFTESLGPG